MDKYGEEVEICEIEGCSKKATKLICVIKPLAILAVCREHYYEHKANKKKTYICCPDCHKKILLP